MLGLLHSYFSEIRFDSIAKARKQNKPNYVSRDDLDKRKSPSKLKKRAEGEAKPLLHKEDGKKPESERLRVKILMTKEEAARLLSRCKDGGVLEFKDVARELVHIPASRVSVASSSTCSDPPVLVSIPEEL
ncbi:Nipped-B-like protein [Actinidia chinensis var. chinensis]|uniref:Nipped-B-like protein n=1 Tax=Actinidia chinensis var. chinensis TaxID=1590841 RepID=A0A2R6QN35_ACTCC|nr:Nipped-B-like protein [Actinidia chinensis var. chinensis]